MHFLIDKTKNVLFGWSAKCGCSHIKAILQFLKNDKIDVNNIHDRNTYNALPADFKDYTIIIICRNPYKRLVSGFLDKYKKDGDFRHLWKADTLTFSNFIDELVKENWNLIDNHHFTRQTSESFDYKILEAKCVKFFDIENIDYSYIEKVYDKKIPEYILSQCRNARHKGDKNLDKYVYDLDIYEYYDFNVDIKYFYNENIANKVLKYYGEDFKFFRSVGLDYFL